ncbi:UDP-N-acetylglucosamine 1-carboxyvinyltransferase [Patescibacteria group bacterium]|nr:UDP-N-acetylglucosamine 1-carboxyvinyltransferase [Patescibacteria group bacterium]MCG2694549.1 UDP-N-acetylglucosamine 1-carboxyvinyltransferase [Candidatus Parcubacteria bacterium]
MNDKFVVKGLNGKKTLSGKIRVNGAKNAVLKLMASTILFEDKVELLDIPEIEDVKRMLEILEDLGVKIERKEKGHFVIDTSKAKETVLNREISEMMRASIVLTGPILSRFGEVTFPIPGGCVIGARAIDFFIDGFKKMGASVNFDKGAYIIKAKGKKLRGAEIFLKTPSVTATETFIMAGVLANGKTVIKNSALEPEIKNLADYLISCGAKIKGAGTSRIEITGGNLLKSKGKKYKAMPDRVETGSFLVLGALCADNLEITNCNPDDVEILLEILKDSGVLLEVKKNSILIKNNGKIKNKEFKSVNIKTKEYPGFPTDLQAPMVVFLTQASGEALVFETIFEGRLNYTEDLKRMGADILMLDPHRVLVKGPAVLRGRKVESPDLRAGLAFIIAGILAKGESIIDNVYLIDRGYENIEERLRKIGVDIERFS